MEISIEDQALMKKYNMSLEDLTAVKSYHAQWADSPYPPVFITTDALVLCNGKVLLVKRGKPPFKGMWALPGGHLEIGETLLDCAVRELWEETSLNVGAQSLKRDLHSIKVYDEPDRDPRGRFVSHCHFFNVSRVKDMPGLNSKGGDDTQAAQWFDYHTVTHMKLFLDHNRMVRDIIWPLVNSLNLSL